MTQSAKARNRSKSPRDARSSNEPNRTIDSGASLATTAAVSMVMCPLSWRSRGTCVCACVC